MEEVINFNIESLIYEIRGQRVMLDRDLAMLYQVETRSLNQAVKRNIERFPEDFMFQLTRQEYANLMSQFVISSLETSENKNVNNSDAWGGTRKMPYAFTEHGALALAGILRSGIAVDMSIRITRAFVSMRRTLMQLATSNLQVEELRSEIKQLRIDVNEILTDQNEINEMNDRRMTGIEKQIDNINDALALLSSGNSQQFINSQRTHIKGFTTENK